MTDRDVNPYEHLALDINALVELKRSREYLNPLDDPATSFIAALELPLVDVGYIAISPDTGNYVSRSKLPLDNSGQFAYNLFLRINVAMDNHKWSQRVDLHQENTLVQHYAALKVLKETATHTEEPLQQYYALATIALIAALHKPDDYSGAERIVRRKRETEDAQIFRTAINFLWDTQHIQPSKEQNQLWSELSPDDRRQAYYEESPRGDAMRHIRQRYGRALIAEKLLEVIANPKVTAEAVTFELEQQLKRDEEASKPQELVPVNETTWTILPPGTLDEISHTTNSSGGETISFVDPKRLTWLASIAVAWNAERSYIVVANLTKTGDYDYRVAVLPDRINGVLVEHAIAENPHSGNAAYVFRAEQGLADGVVRLSWKDALSHDKPSARQLGARKIVHNSNFGDNVLEYLTRPAKDLNKPGYKR